MKNKLMKSLFCIILLFCMTTVVYAGPSNGNILSPEEGNDSTSANVTVGNVETPVYGADLYWESLIFDWVYDNSTKEFNWTPVPICERYYPSEEMTWEEAFASETSIYTDSTCSTKANEYNESISEYYHMRERENAFMHIWDMTTGGQIVPSVEWNSNDKYNNVIGKFSYIKTESVCTIIDSVEMFDSAISNNVTLYSNDSCSNIIVEDNLEYENNSYYAFVNTDLQEVIYGGEIPDYVRNASAGVYHEYRFTEVETATNTFPKKNYTLYLTLENNPEKAAVTPTQGEVIGTITISIRAK